MNDPAVAAAKRALNELIEVNGDPGAMGPVLWDLSWDAAREALKPIREQCAALQGFGESLVEEGGPLEASKGAGILEAVGVLAPFIFGEEELS